MAAGEFDVHRDCLEIGRDDRPGGSRHCEANIILRQCDAASAMKIGDNNQIYKNELLTLTLPLTKCRLVPEPSARGRRSNH
jgi:hypothetical protein